VRVRRTHPGRRVPRPRPPLREGDRVLVSVGDQLRRGELLRLEDLRDRRLAEVRFEDGTYGRFDTFLLRLAQRPGGHWWWPSKPGLRISFLVLVFTAMGSLVAVLTFLGVGSHLSAGTTTSTTTPISSVSATLDLSSSMIAYDSAAGHRWEVE